MQPKKAFSFVRTATVFFITMGVIATGAVAWALSQPTSAIAPMSLADLVQRAQSPVSPDQSPQVDGPLAPLELDLLANYRQCSEQKQARLRRIAAMLVTSQGRS